MQESLNILRKKYLRIFYINKTSLNKFFISLLFLFTLLEKFLLVYKFEKEYHIIRIFVYLISLLLAITNLKKLLLIIIRYKFILSYFIAIIYLILSSLLFSHFSNPYFFSYAKDSYILSFIVAFVILCISCIEIFTEREIKFLLISLISAAILLGIISIYKEQSITLVVNESYLDTKQGQIGVTLGFAYIACLNFLKFNRNKSIQLIIGLITCFILLEIIILRYRSVLLGTILVTLIFLLILLIHHLTYRKIIIAFMIVLITIVLSLSGNMDIFYNLIYDSFFLGKTSTLSSLTSGRSDRIIEYSKILIVNPFFGYGFPNYSNMHFSIWGYLVDIGILIALPILYIYFAVFAIIPILLKKCNKFLDSILGYYLLLSFIVSLFETNAPFGPGLTFIFIWFLLGQWLIMNG